MRMSRGVPSHSSLGGGAYSVHIVTASQGVAQVPGRRRKGVAEVPEPASRRHSSRARSLSDRIDEIRETNPSEKTYIV
jgi:hypothetical protein